MIQTLVATLMWALVASLLIFRRKRTDRSITYAALTIAIAHLSLGAQSRKSQIDFIADLLGDHPHAVLMGDFNCDPDRPEMQTLYRKTKLQPPANCVPTFPSWRPQRAIDHMLVTPALGISEMKAVPAALSDHLALSVELDIPESAFE